MVEYENLKKFNEVFTAEFKKQFESVLESGRYILGEKVAAFEKEFAEYIGCNHCIGVASGLDALILSLACYRFEKGSEVIAPSNTYIATINSIIQTGLKPVLVEPDIETYNIDPEKIEEKISPKTKVIIPVHLYGKPCSMERIIDIAKTYNLKIIEDCAQSHGAKFKNQITGSFGDFGDFSFYPTKNLGTLGDAGAVITGDPELAAKIIKLRNYGSSVKYKNDLIGYNSRLDEVQASFLSVKLKKLDDIISHKRKLADIYHRNLKEDFIKPSVDEDCFDVFHIFNIRHPERNKLRNYLRKNDIITEIHYPIPPHKQKSMKGFFENQEFPISEEIHNTTISLPISYFHTEDDIYDVIETLNKF